MRTSRSLNTMCVAAAALLCWGARADYTGYFAVPDNGGVNYLANAAVGNWYLSSSGTGGEATLSRTPGLGGVATSLTLSTIEGGTAANYGLLTITNSDLLHGYELNWGYVTSTFDGVGDEFARFDNGIYTVLETAVGLHVGTGTTTLLPGQSFGWRVTQHPGDNNGESVALTMASVREVSPVPEPSAAILALLGLAGCGLLRRRRN